MITYTGSRALFGTLTNNTSTTNLTLGDQLINQFTLQLVHSFPALFSERTFNLLTYPSQQFYTIPMSLRKVNTVQVTVGNFTWPVKEVPSREFWNQINLVTNISSDIPQYYFFYNNQVGIYPKPANGYNALIIQGQLEVTGTSIIDVSGSATVTIPYALVLTGTCSSGALKATLTSTFPLPTGTYQMIFSDNENILVNCYYASTGLSWTHPLVSSVGNTVSLRTATGGDIITSASSIFTTVMNGFYFNMSQISGGDGYWYKIDTVYSTTQASLVSSYNGLAISGVGASYTIGQSSIIPEAYQYIPVYRAVEVYYTTISKDESRQKTYKTLGDELFALMKSDYGNKDTDPTVNDDVGKQPINPNLTVNITSSTNTNSY